MASRPSLMTLLTCKYALMLFLMISAQASARDCYFPNGQLARDGIPCSEYEGACCPLNLMCFSNGMCLSPIDGSFQRHLCTDKTWEAQKCPNFCLNREYANYKYNSE